MLGFSPLECQLGMMGEGAVEPSRIGIDQQLRGIEAVPLIRREGAVGAQSIALACADAGDKSNMHMIAPFRQDDALRFAVLRIIEADFDTAGILGEDGDAGAAFDQCHA